MALKALEVRNVDLDEIADLVYYLQEKYHDDLSREECLSNVKRYCKTRGSKRDFNRHSIR